jgi:hypothetical protein
MPDNEIKLKIVIDGKEALASISLTDNELKKLAQSVREAGNESRNSGEKIVHAFAQARNLIQGLKETFLMFAQTFQSHIIAYQEQEAALIKLNTALQQTGQFTEDNVKALTDYAAKLQQTTVYGDEVTESVMAQLLAMGLSVEQTKQATLQAANLATVMGTDLNTAARAMADLFNGNIGLIGRYVKGLDEAVIKSGDLDKIISMLNERIGGQAEAIGKTSVGALARMNNAIGDLKENTGELLSNALSPFISMISDLVKSLNNLSPTASGVVGLVTSMTTAFITLRVTGILPAINSIELFGVAINGLKLTLIKSGIGALIVGLGYGLSELAKAYEHFQNVKAGAEGSFDNLISQIRSDALKAKKEELKWLLKDAETQKSKLQSDIEKLKNDINKAKEEIVTKDKEGNVYRNFIETEESKRLNEQLKQLQYLLKIEETRIQVYNEILNQKQQTKKLTDEELKKEFEKNKNILLEQQRHEEVMLKLQEDNELLSLQLKKKHLEQLLELYRQYGQDTQEILNRIKETELELKIKTKPPNIPEIYTTDEPIDIELPDVKYGNALEYARLTKEQELELWRQKEYEKVKEYENSSEMIKAIDEEYMRRKRELALEENIIYTSLQESFQSAAYAIASAGSSAVQVFRQANSVLQIFINSLVQAFVHSLALKAAMSAFNLILGGIGNAISVTTPLPTATMAAEGAIVTKPTLMVVGEGKYPEGVFPLPYLNSLVNNQPVNVNLQIQLSGSSEIDGFKLRQLIKKVEREIKIKR